MGSKFNIMNRFDAGDSGNYEARCRGGGFRVKSFAGLLVGVWVQAGRTSEQFLPAVLNASCGKWVSEKVKPSGVQKRWPTSVTGDHHHPGSFSV